MENFSFLNFLNFFSIKDFSKWFELKVQLVSYHIFPSVLMIECIKFKINNTTKAIIEKNPFTFVSSDNRKFDKLPTDAASLLVKSNIDFGISLNGPWKNVPTETAENQTNHSNECSSNEEKLLGMCVGHDKSSKESCLVPIAFCFQLIEEENF